MQPIRTVRARVRLRVFLPVRASSAATASISVVTRRRMRPGTFVNSRTGATGSVRMETAAAASATVNVMTAIRVPTTPATSLPTRATRRGMTTQTAVWTEALQALASRASASIARRARLNDPISVRLSATRSSRDLIRQRARSPASRHQPQT